MYGFSPIGAYAIQFEGSQKQSLEVVESIGVSGKVKIKIVRYFRLEAAPFPLSKKQVESAMAMRSLQPQIKAIQARYACDQERLKLETARLCKLAGINPLAVLFIVCFQLKNFTFVHAQCEEYKLFWNGQNELVRMAAKLAAAIVPFGAVGEDYGAENCIARTYTIRIAWES
ncbi:ALBINO3-like protein 1, chloroplastic [Artemisia annua]|uniref:ALBINO3-like protein 1, chloroplastic n=1 Tax=Artemisia annua TaxID=35608 RepID=A0A2U1M4H5_ARTAN|nr:ALBINO3-like protein 1, chloroplastic [Artemisia annua]